MRNDRERLAGLLRERELRAERALQSAPGGLIHFVRRFWHILEPGRDLVDGWALNAVCDHLEAVGRGEIRRLLINVPPGFMKSLLTNVFWVAWMWGPLDKADQRFLAFSYAAHLTERDNEKFRDLVRSPEYQQLWGHRVRLTADGKIKVSNDRKGWKLASSVNGISTGERADHVLFDDPHSVKEAESEVVRTGTTTWFREGMQNRLNDMEQSSIVVIMQRVHEADVSGVVLKHYPEYVHLCIPMEYEPARRCITPIWSDPRKRAGELAWPERFPARALVGFKAQSYLWSGQYQQSPSPRGGGIIKEAWWRPFIGEFPAFEYVVASVDTAYTEKQENDPSALTLWGVYADRKHNGLNRVVLIDAWEERLELNALVKRIMATCKRAIPDVLLIEAKATGISVAQEFKRLYRDPRTVVRLVDPKQNGGGDKVARIHSISALLETGLVEACATKVGETTVFDPPAKLLIDQMCAFPKAPHDDLVDSASQCLRYLRRTHLRMEAEFVEDEREASVHRGSRERQSIYPV